MTAHQTTTSHSDDTATSDEPKVAKNGIPDFAGILERFKLPGIDLGAYVESRKLDIDAVTQATAAAFGGAQTIVDKQAEMLKTVLTEIGDAFRKTPEGASEPADLVHRQQELANHALTSVLSSMRDIAETARKAQSDIIEVATNRMRTSVEEIRSLTKRAETPESKAK